MSFNVRRWLSSEVIFGSVWVSLGWNPLGLDRAGLIRFRVDNAGVFQRVAMNLNMTVGQATCRLLCRYTQKPVGCFLCLLNRTDCMCELGERTSSFSCLKCI